MAWSGLPKSRTQNVLDAGCGRGGTAAYMCRAGWGRVTGMTSRGNQSSEPGRPIPKFPSKLPAEQSHRVGKETFDIVCCFQLVLRIPDQAAALFRFRPCGEIRCAASNLRLYGSGTFGISPLAKQVELQRWNPLKLSGVGSLLDNAGWSLEVIRDVSTDYERWYRTSLPVFTTCNPCLFRSVALKSGNTPRSFTIPCTKRFRLGYGRRNCLRGKARLKEFSHSDEVYVLFWTFCTNGHTTRLQQR